jgi:uncharacterized protein YndB with AHSA1/START domain
MNPITVTTDIRSDIGTVWKAWTEPAHITHWNFASADWECPAAENDPQVGGRFSYTMAAKDGSASFDFTGTYTDVIPEKRIAYTMDDSRKSTIDFAQNDNTVHVTETFDPEQINTEELQRNGWQSILDNFKTYVESLKS